MANVPGLDPGDLDRRVRISALTEGVDDAGAPIEIWSPLADVWASKNDIDARERFQAEQSVASYDTRWRMHYRADLDPELVDVPTTRRLVYLGREHDIVVANHLGRKTAIELLTVARTVAP